MAHNLNYTVGVGDDFLQCRSETMQLLELRVVKLKSLTFLIVLFLSVGCGKKGLDQLPWPAQVKLIGLSAEQEKNVFSSLSGFTNNSGKEIFYFDDRPSQFQITIGKLKVSPETTSKAGLATYNRVSCKVELNEVVFSEDYKDYFDPVLWHELGHCSGMEHDPKEGEIMYHIASPKNFYKTDAITRFVNSFDGLIALFGK
jgi:hypothetical protein